MRTESYNKTVARGSNPSGRKDKTMTKLSRDELLKIFADIEAQLTETTNEVMPHWEKLSEQDRIDYIKSFYGPNRNRKMAKWIRSERNDLYPKVNLWDAIAIDLFCKICKKCGYTI